MSSSSQDQINKIKAVRDKRTIVVLGTGVTYAIVAHFISGLPNYSEISPIFLPLTLGIGVGLLMVGFSITLNYETDKRLILMESKFESKLEQINNNLAKQPSMDSIQNKIDNNYFHIQILEIKNELNTIKEELKRDHS